MHIYTTSEQELMKLISITSSKEMWEMVTVRIYSFKLEGGELFKESFRNLFCLE